MNRLIVAASLGAVLATEIVSRHESGNPHVHFDLEYPEQNSRIGISVYGDLNRSWYHNQAIYRPSNNNRETFVSFPTMNGSSIYKRSRISLNESSFK